jgi:hypothetical protein
VFHYLASAQSLCDPSCIMLAYAPSLCLRLAPARLLCCGIRGHVFSATFFNTRLHVIGTFGYFFSVIFFSLGFFYWFSLAVDDSYIQQPTDSFCPRQCILCKALYFTSSI